MRSALHCHPQKIGRGSYITLADLLGNETHPLERFHSMVGRRCENCGNEATYRCPYSCHFYACDTCFRVCVPSEGPGRAKASHLKLRGPARPEEVMS